MANARLRNEPSIQWREQRQWATWRTSSGRFWRNCLVRPCFNTLAQRGHESWSGLQVPLWWGSLYVFVMGATWVTTKRSQPTLRDLKQSLESLLLDTSRLEASRSPRYSRYSIRSSSTKMAPAPWIPYDTVRILFCFLLAHIVVLSVFSKAITVTCVYTSWVLQRHL